MLRALGRLLPRAASACGRHSPATQGQRAIATVAGGWVSRAGAHRPSAMGAGGSLLPGQHGAGQVRTMFIQTSSTPNPNSLMFVPGKTVLENGSLDFTSARAAMVSPLAKKLFLVDGVKGVFLGSDFVTVTKDEYSEWSLMKPEVFGAIMDHYSSGEPVVMADHEAAGMEGMIHEDDSEVVAMIKELLETRIRPSVQEDGGDIIFKGFDECAPETLDRLTGIVTIKMVGSCEGCPSSSVTLKHGIENMLKHYIEEVTSVEPAEPDELDIQGEDEFKKFEKSLEQAKKDKLEGVLSN